MENRFDVVVIGGGPGGTPAAMQLASSGKSVLLVEEMGKLGGACLFVGCIPSKIIRYWADEIVAERTLLGKDNWTEEEQDRAWKKIRDKTDVILHNRSSAAMKKAQSIPTLKFIEGTARFISKNEIVVEKRDGQKNNYSFGNAIIATGARSFVPPFEGDGASDVLVSEKFFSLEKLPKSLLIIGGGPIGVELSQMLSKLNVECTIVEMMDTILSGIVNGNYSAMIKNNLEKDGVEIHTSSRVKAINKTTAGFRVRFSDAENSEKEQDFENVLVVAGKIPNIDSIDLDKAGVEANKKGIVVNEFLETSANGIHASGDVINGPRFAHTATYEANIVSANILTGKKHSVDFSKNSWVLFSEPEIATAGLTKADAIKKGIDAITGVYDYKIDAAAQVADAPFGYLEYVVNKTTMQILGVTIVNDNAAELAGEAALIVANRLSLADVAHAIHPHPTKSEAFGMLAGKMLSMMNK